MSEKRDRKDLILGGLAGALAGFLTTQFLVKPKETKITLRSNIDLIEQREIVEETTLLDKTYKFGLMLIHGDGDSSVTITITKQKGTETISNTLNGNEQGIEIIANERVIITGSGTGKTPTIEILYLEW
ncbi:MAG: hypothetical protein QXS19_05805 [Candidatus Methanomethylicia archaeon]